MVIAFAAEVSGKAELIEKIANLEAEVERLKPPKPKRAVTLDRGN